MRVRVPFIYKAQLLKARHQIERSYLLLGEESFDIAEVSWGNTIIAAQMNWQQNHAPLGSDNISIQTNYPVCSHGIMKPLEISIKRDLPYFPGLPIKTNQLQEYLDQWAKEAQMDLNRYGIPWQERNLHDRKKQTPFLIASSEIECPVESEGELIKSAQWLWSERNLVVEALARAIEQSAIIDGIVYAPSLGPVLQIRHTQPVNSNPLVEIFAHRERAKTLGLMNAYSPARETKILARIEELKNSQVGNLEIRNKHELKVFYPESFNADIRAIRVRNACSSLLSGVCADVGKYPTSALVSYGRLRDECERFKYDIDFSRKEQDHMLELAFNLDHARLKFLGRQKTAYDPLGSFRKKNINKETVDEDVVPMGDNEMAELDTHIHQ